MPGLLPSQLKCFPCFCPLSTSFHIAIRITHSCETCNGHLAYSKKRNMSKRCTARLRYLRDTPLPTLPLAHSVAACHTCQAHSRVRDYSLLFLLPGPVFPQKPAWLAPSEFSGPPSSLYSKSSPQTGLS